MTPRMWHFGHLFLF